MYFQYNNLRQPLASTRVTIDTPDQSRDTFGNLLKANKRWVIDGEVLGATPAEITAALRPLEQAYNRDGGDAILYLPDGVTPSIHTLLSRDTIGGVRSGWVSYPIGDGPEYVNGRRWRLVLSAEYAPQGISNNDILSYDSRVSIIGNGGPQVVIRRTRNTKPIPQQTSRFTEVRASQVGSASSYGTWPQPDPPIWPQWLVNPEQAVERMSPKQAGSGALSAVTTYVTTWTYQYVSPEPLTGYPSRRTR